MKPERIQIVPPFGDDNFDPEYDWNATFTFSRTFKLEPSAQVAFLAGVLPRAQSLPAPPKIVCAIEPMPEQGNYLTKVDLEWSDSGPVTDIEIDFAHWIGAFHDHLVVAPMAPN